MDNDLTHRLMMLRWDRRMRSVGVLRSFVFLSFILSRPSGVDRHRLSFRFLDCFLDIL